MGHSTEKAVLIPKGGVKTANTAHKVRFFVSLGIVLLVFKGSEEIASTTFKQYVYIWCKKYVNDSERISANTSNIGVEANAESNSSAECRDGTESRSEEDKAQAMASQWQMYYEILGSILTFVSTAVYGTLSDFVGRKKIGILCLFGYAMRCALYAIVCYYDLHVGYFLIAYLVDGLCGSTTTFSLYCYSSSADITDNVRDRVLGVALIEAMIGTGITSTNIATGFYINRYGYFYPFLTAASGVFFSLLLAVIVMKETNVTTESLQSRQVQSDSKTRPSTPSIRTLFDNYVGFYVSREQKGKRAFWLALVVFFLVEFVIYGRSNPLTLYQLGRPFCWSSELIGWFTGAYTGSQYILGVVAVKPILQCVSEHVAACIGVVSAIAYNVIIGLASSTLDLFIALIPGFLGALPKSIIRGMVSSRVSGHKQGAVFAGLQSSELICRLVAGPICISIYSHTLDTMRGCLFLVLAGVCCVTLILQIWLSILVRKESSKEQLTITVGSPDDPIS